MSDIKSKPTIIANLLKSANDLDALGRTAEAEQLTKLAAAQVAEMKEDADMGDADGDVAEGDPMAKGFGKSMCTLYAKLCKLDSGNLQKKLTALKEAKGSKDLDIRAIRNGIETLIDALAPLCK